MFHDIRSSEVTSAFGAHFDRAPTQLGHAPGRVNLIGEHTDHNGGRCLPFALPQRTYTAAAFRSDDIVRVHSEQTGETVTHRLSEAQTATGWAAYVVGTLAALEVTRGVDLLVSSDVPLGAGLSSSAALTCSVAVAIAPDRSTELLLAATIRAENDYVGAPTGGLDQTIALRASEGTALLLDFSRPTPRRVVRSVRSTLPGHEWWIVDTHVSHALADGSYAQRRDECRAAAVALGVDTLSCATSAAVERLARTEPLLAARARHVISENERVRKVVIALEDDDPAAVGSALTASHVSLRDDFAVSCRELDESVDVLLAHGARGARLVGGGFGGSVLALLPESRVADALSAVTRHFRSRGWRLPTPLDAGSGAGGAVGSTRLAS